MTSCKCDKSSLVGKENEALCACAIQFVIFTGCTPFATLETIKGLVPKCVPQLLPGSFRSFTVPLFLSLWPKSRSKNVHSTQIFEQRIILVNCLSLVVMEVYKVCFTLVAITLTVFSSVANGDEFAKAYTKIEKVKPNIYY